MNNPTHITFNGNNYDNDAVFALMDHDICEDIHSDLAPCSDQVFFDVYLVAHREKYGSDFIIN